MKPAPFDYVAAQSLDEALHLLAHRPGARLLAGGQSLIPMLNMRLLTPPLLIDVMQIPALEKIKEIPDGVEIGATVTQAACLAWPGIEDLQPLLTLVLPLVGHYQTRQRGTVCGSLAHADPSSELPLIVALLDGELVLQRSGKTRILKARDFQLGAMATALAPGEMIVACRIRQRRTGEVYAFREVSQRHGDFAMVAMALVADARGVRIGVAGVAQTPTLLDLPWLEGAPLETALNEFAWQLGARDDLHASAAYRRGLVRNLGRALVREIADAGA